ncbi:MAG: hypothetical protein MK010_04600 [Erythrobacter sp.]|nr:hypothetical protein [Erythrobacter sp.]
MASLAIFLSPLLLFAASAAEKPVVDEQVRVDATDQLRSDATSLTEEAARRRSGAGSSAAPWWVRFAPDFRAPAANQVRIERRVIVRISPRAVPAQSFAPTAVQTRAPVRFVARPMDDCLPVSSIAGVRASNGNRLLLYLRDRRLVSAQLERSCSSRDYYSGFYFEPNEDGRLCVDRDRLLSRTGAKCSLSNMSQLVAVAGE